MTKRELLTQFARLQARKLLGWRSDDECRQMACDWHRRFSRIDNDICQRSMSAELGRIDYPSVERVLARARDVQWERNDAKRRAEPEPERPGPWTMEQKIKWRAVIHTLGEHPLTQAEAEAKARAEIEAETAEGGA